MRTKNCAIPSAAFLGNMFGDVHVTTLLLSTLTSRDPERSFCESLACQCRPSLDVLGPGQERLRRHAMRNMALVVATMSETMRAIVRPNVRAAKRAGESGKRAAMCASSL